MRPYQIFATERIINRIHTSSNVKKTGTLEAGGYIWHTTGSGKTLTSFKTAQLATALPDVDKVLFIVDRKDLDYQTMAEYDRFEKGQPTATLPQKCSRGSWKTLKLALSSPPFKSWKCLSGKTARILFTNNMLCSYLTNATAPSSGRCTGKL